MDSSFHGSSDPAQSISHVLAGGGEMGALMRSIDWAQTPIGVVDEWPQSLRTVLSILLASRHPIFVWWGPELIQFYNDAYRPILGATKHPAAMGQRGRECWREIWDVIAPMIEAVMTRGEATFLEDSLLVLDRNGYLEECYFVYAYSPIRDEAGKVGGVFVACNETTSKVVAARRLRTLRDLANRAVGAASDQQACEHALQILGDNPTDVPFAALYLRDGDDPQARLIATKGVPASAPGFPPVLSIEGGTDSTTPIVQVVREDAALLINDVVTRFGMLSGGPWPEAPTAALVLPLHDTAHPQPIGALVAGLSPRLPYDDDYRGFFDLVADHISTAIANARTVGAERQRAEALAALDRAKTIFFSNVSHEFRTPLTLLLGPTEEALAHTTDAAQRQRLELIQRNALRLQKLVNMLLDFSRIEAGRFHAVYVPTNLAVYTAELASLFRSAIEQAGLHLHIDCPALSAPIYVDRDMYEKVVLNLVANAFKYTFAGDIGVTLREQSDSVALVVSDTGTGIAPEHLERIFERFQRVEGAQGRTHEGTGIGLALVHELVKLHGGSISVESSLGRGSTFTVRLPKGSAHLPATHIGDEPQTDAQITHPIGNAVQVWFEPTAPAAEQAPAVLQWWDNTRHVTTADRPRIVWADDNADMREYVRRLLADYYVVVAVANGRAALEAVQAQPPDLVLCDLMMPELDGIGLVRALREDPRTRTIPIILLSARAGEEAQLAGLDLGVDDYLIKPFSARELLARVRTHIYMTRLRRDAEAALRASDERTRLALDVAQLGTWNVDFTTGLVQADARCREICGFPPSETLSLETILPRIHPADQSRIKAALEAVRRPDSDGVYAEEFRFVHPDGTVHWVASRGQLDLVSLGAHQPAQLLGTILDISTRRQAEEQLRQAHRELELRVQQRTVELQESNAQLAAREARLQTLLRLAPVGIFETDAQGGCTFVNEHWLEITGMSDDGWRGDGWTAVIHPDDRERMFRAWNTAAATGGNYKIEARYQRPDGSVRWIIANAAAITDATKQTLAYLGTVIDISERKASEDALRASEERQRLLLRAIPDAMLRVSRDGVYRDAVEAHSFPLVVPPNQIIGTRLADVLPPDLAVAKLKVIADALDTAMPQQLDYQWPTGDQLRDLEDRVVPSSSDEVLILVRDVTARKQIERQLQAALAEKEVLLKEVHHRVKNNLQVIISLLRLQSETLTDPAVRELFRDSQNRVRAMALVHEQLYGSPDLGRVPFANYLRKLADTLLRFYLVREGQIRVTYDLEPMVLLPIDAAVPLGLILAELLSNSIKHAFPDRRAGSIAISMRQSADGLTISVSDDGIGLPRGLELAQAHSLGLQIIGILIVQLAATLAVTSEKGTHFQIVIPNALH